MNARQRHGLDPRAWLVWSLAASLPALLGRNPWPLMVALLAVVAVRLAWADRMHGGQGWRSFVRLAVIFAAIGVVFNALTVRSGNHVIATIPDVIPLLGGDVTLNAVVFGVLSGFALVLLVLTGSTVAALLDWSMVVRLLPPGLTNIAVAGSVAFTFIPQTGVALREVREAQAARGHRVRGARDLLPILVPVVGGGLERAMTLAESLESRAFGAPASPDALSRTWPRYAVATGLGAVAVAAYLIATGHPLGALLALAIALTAGVSAIRAGRGSAMRRTRYRTPVWSWRDTAVVAGASIAILGTILTIQFDAASLRYEPYPALDVPRVGLSLLLALMGLLVPALVAPVPDAERGAA